MKDKAYVVYEWELEGIPEEYKELIIKEESRVASYLTLEEVISSILAEFDITEVKYSDVEELVKNAKSLPYFEFPLMQAYGKSLRDYIDREAVEDVKLKDDLKKIVEFDQKMSRFNKGNEI